MKKLVSVLLVLCFMFSMCACGKESVQETETTASEEMRETSDNSAPDFRFYDADGNSYSLSDFKGKPVVLNFWASWCGPCQGEMPYFQSMYEEYGDSIEFLMVNLTDGETETQDSASGFIANSGYTFPVYYDSDRQGAYAYGIYSIPDTYFISSDGSIYGYKIGALDEETLKSYLQAMS